MNIVMNVFNWLIAAGPTVLLPVIITIIGMIFGLRIDKAFKSGLTLGIGFAGIKLILDFMTTNVGPAAKAMVERTGAHLTALDVGWGLNCCGDLGITDYRYFDFCHFGSQYCAADYQADTYA